MIAVIIMTAQFGDILVIFFRLKDIQKKVEQKRDEFTNKHPVPIKKKQSSGLVSFQIGQKVIKQNRIIIERLIN